MLKNKTENIKQTTLLLVHIFIGSYYVQGTMLAPMGDEKINKM